ncbi:ABC transporter substrate-binding protein [Nocardia carnea]|uniref:ABC transporter substrate-binding protein n=2 Tax=Nocardia carnea TaxID=37328 RepID=UPI0024560B36|nr:ABC transporter substrate-binding protein [Nocardia carnea]
MRTRAIQAALAAAAVLVAVAGCGSRDDAGESVASGDCQGQQTTGLTDTAMKLGGIFPLSGPASAYAELPKGMQAYFEYVNNEQGGIDGRTVEYLLRDDGYQPPKTVEETRRLVEQDQVFAILSTLGTPTSAAVWDYLNQREVPQIFVAGGATQWGAGEGHPWTIGWQPSYHAEGQIFARYVMEQQPDATVAVVYQNDDFGKDLLASFKEATTGSGVKVIAEQSYEVTDPSVDPQLRNLADSKADVLLNFATPKFAAQTLAADARNPEWNPLHILTQVSSTMSVLAPVGFPNVQNVVTSVFVKDPADPQWADDPGMRLYRDKLAQYVPGADPSDGYTLVGWAMAQSFHKTFDAAACKTREGLRDAMRSLDNVAIDLLLPGITLQTGAGDGYPMEAMQIQRFQGDRWVLEGDLVDTSGN